MKMIRTSLSAAHRPCLGVLVSAALLLNGCVTTGTRDRIASEPMGKDLEKQVLTQTGLTGAVAGALIGGLLAATLTGVVSKASGASNEVTKRRVAIAATGGMITGGAIGYQQGQQQGQKIIHAALQRDDMSNLLSGARKRNASIAEYNARLKTRIASAQQISDPRAKQRELSGLRREAEKELKSVDSTIKDRKKALDYKPSPQQSSYVLSESQKESYRRPLNVAINERAELVAQINKIAATESAIQM